MAHSFAELYLAGCKLLDDTPQYLNNYSDLDNVRKFIEEHDKKDQLIYALSRHRTCIVLPYELFEDKRLPPDDVDDEGQQVIFACPGWDQYVSEIIDHMQNDLVNNQCRREQSLVKWKLLRLGKMFDLGWDTYCEQYLEPLKNPDYIKNFLLAR